MNKCSDITQISFFNYTGVLWSLPVITSRSKQEEAQTAKDSWYLTKIFPVYTNKMEDKTFNRSLHVLYYILTGIARLVHVFDLYLTTQILFMAHTEHV